MSFILLIDTSGSNGFVGISSNGELLRYEESVQQKDHAAWLQVAIDRLLKEENLSLPQIDAVAVAAGPGSYTGLRVALASAKGICYALDKPLICLGTLELMAAAMPNPGHFSLCPMIDARRMEVFTAVFNAFIEKKRPPVALILEPDSFADLLATEKIIFFGNGADKFREIIRNDNAVFSAQAFIGTVFAQMAANALQRRHFSDLAYSEPTYLKGFYTLPKKA